MPTPENSPTPETVKIVPRNATLEELLETLRSGDIPLDEYGVGEAKTLEDLLSEVNEGESTVTIDNKNVVRREVGVLWVDVLCELGNGEVYIIREDRQEFKDGRVRKRSLDSSIGEKLKPGEEPEEATTRALEEELGIHHIEKLHRVGYEEKTFIPPTFPGIESTYKMHKYVSMIPESAFKPEGYVEYQEHKTNYYVWELLHSSAA